MRLFPLVNTRFHLVLAALSAITLGLSTAASAAEQLPKLALANVGAGEGVSIKTAATVEELLLGALEDTHRFKVIGSSDISGLLSFEQKRQAVGCTEDSCMAELAGALGVEYVASANVGRLGDLRVLTFKIIDVKAARVVSRVRRTVANDTELANAIDAVAKEAAGEIPAAKRAEAKAAKLEPATMATASAPPAAVASIAPIAPPSAAPVEAIATATVEPTQHTRWPAYTALALGAATLIGGATFSYLAHNDASTLKSGPQSGAVQATRLANVNTNNDRATWLFGGGAAILVGGGVLFFVF